MAPSPHLVLTSADLLPLILSHLVPCTSLASQTDFSRLSLVHPSWTQPVLHLMSRHPLLGSNEGLLGFQEHLRSRSFPPSDDEAYRRRREDDVIPAAGAVRSLMIDFAQPKHTPRPGSGEPLLSAHSAQSRTLKELYLDPCFVRSLRSLTSLSLGYVRLHFSSLRFLLESIASTLRHLGLHDLTFSDKVGPAWTPSVPRLGSNGGPHSISTLVTGTQVMPTLAEVVLEGLPHLESLELTGALADVSFLIALSNCTMRPSDDLSPVLPVASSAVPSPLGTPARSPSIPLHEQGPDEDSAWGTSTPLPLKRLQLVECRCPVRHRHHRDFPHPWNLVDCLAPTSWLPHSVFRMYATLAPCHRIEEIVVKPGNFQAWSGYPAHHPNLIQQVPAYRAHLDRFQEETGIHVIVC